MGIPLSVLPEFLHSQLIVKLPVPTTSWKGKTVIVTGASAGLGLEASRHFARLGASKLILAVRTISKGEAARRSIVETTKCSPESVEVWHLDLQSFDSVKAFAARAHKLERLDCVLENAAVATMTFCVSEGWEESLTTNVISTFLLGALVTPKLRETAEKKFPDSTPHLTIVSSDTQFMAPFPERKERQIFKELNDEKKARMMDRYPLTKLLENLVVRQWAKEYFPQDGETATTASSVETKKSGKKGGVVLNTVNPGLCYSELRREVPTIAYWLFIFWFEKLFCRTTEEGSRTFMHAVSAGPESNGEYLSDCKVHHPVKLTEGEEGRRLQGKVWGELREVLEGIEPGVTKALKG